MTTRWADRTLVCALAIAIAGGGASAAARADLLSDPQAVYAAMKAQYQRGAEHGWKFADWQDYFSAVLDAGRAYALRRPDDPNALEVAGVAVDVATKLRYDPLTNRDASEWYVRDAAAKTIAAGDGRRSSEARALVARLDEIEGSVAALGRAAYEDASSNAKDFPGDPQALVEQVAAAWKAWLLTKDPSYRAAALQRAAAGDFPLARLSEPVSTELVAAARAVSAGGEGFSADDVEAARTIILRHVAARGRAEPISHERLLAMRAPADEYFGRMRMSVLGIRNEIVKLNKYLDVGWGAQMAGEGEELADAIESWHHEYPHDTGLPDALLRTYRTLERIAAEPATSAAQRLRRLLIVEYLDSDQARELLST